MRKETANIDILKYLGIVTEKLCNLLEQLVDSLKEQGSGAVRAVQVNIATKIIIM